MPIQVGTLHIFKKILIPDTLSVHRFSTGRVTTGTLKTVAMWQLGNCTVYNLLEPFFLGATNKITSQCRLPASIEKFEKNLQPKLREYYSRWCQEDTLSDRRPRSF